MKTNIRRTPYKTIYQLIFDQQLLGLAEISHHAIGQEVTGVIELTADPEQMKQSGLSLLPEPDWQTFVEISPGVEMSLISEMLGTIIRGFADLRTTLEVQLRKTVEDLSIRKDNIWYQFVMITDLAAPGDYLLPSFEPKCFVYDPDDFEIWQFVAGIKDEDIYNRIYPDIMLRRTCGRR